MGLTKQQIVSWLQLCAEVFSEQRDFLTQLDTEIGDGDHGVNMKRGFDAVAADIDQIASKQVISAGGVFGELPVVSLPATGPLTRRRSFRPSRRKL
mgnify:CR=1 FL=1